jgi:hypothetical protein
MRFPTCAGARRARFQRGQQTLFSKLSYLFCHEMSFEKFWQGVVCIAHQKAIDFGVAVANAGLWPV